MGILKKGIYDDAKVVSLNLNNVSFEDENVSEAKIILDATEYNDVLENASNKGYDDGKEKGYSDGYKDGKAAFELEKAALMEELIASRESLDAALNSEAIRYVNNFKASILDVIQSSISKVFLNSIDSEEIMKVYIIETMLKISREIKDYTVVLNSESYEIVKDSVKIDSYEIDNSLHLYDFRITSNVETTEYLVSEQLEQVLNLFR